VEVEPTNVNVERFENVLGKLTKNVSFAMLELHELRLYKGTFFGAP